MIYLQKKQFILTTILLLLVSSIIYIVVIKKYENDIKDIFLNKEVALYEEKNQLLLEKLELLKKDYSIVYDNDSFKNFIVNGTNKKFVEELFLIFIKKSPYIFQFRYIDNNGKEIIRVDRAGEKSFVVSQDKLQDKKHRYYFKESIALKKDQFWYSRLDLNIENKKIEIPHKPTLRVASPVYYNGKKYGIIISNVNMDKFLNEYVNNQSFNMFIIDGYNNVVFSNFSELNWSKYLKKKIDLSKYLNVDILQTKKEFKLKNGENLSLIVQLKKDVYIRLLNDHRTKLILSILTVNLLILFIIQLINTKKQLNNKIEEQVNKIKQNVSILDQYVIFSRTDIKGIIIEASSAFSKISGYSNGELLGRPHNIVRHPDMDSKTFKELWDTISSGKMWVGEIKNRKKDGTHYWTIATIAPEFDKFNQIKSYISIRHDITDKKALEETKERLIEHEKMASLGTMIGNIAHQWRQPLSVISVSATGLKLQQEMAMLTDEIIIQHADAINKSAQYLSETIETFKNFIKNKKEVKKISLQNAIHDVLNLVEASLKNNYIEIKTNLESLETIEIDTIEGELYEALINIINNSKDALVDKQIKEPWINIELQSNDSKVIITIEDNAGGISDEIKHKIFEPYFTTKHDSQGTGLGLYIVYKIVNESLNGNIHTINTSNGAKFFIELPITI